MALMTRATITIKTDDHRAKIARWAQNVEEGTVVTFRKKSRSTEQNAKMYAMLGEVSEQVEWFGQKLDVDDWKDVFTASLRHARVVPGIDKGTFVPLGMHTSTLTVEEMTNLIELIYAFGAEHGVVFKEPKTDTNSEAAPTSEDADAFLPSASATAAGDTPHSSSADFSADPKTGQVGSVNAGDGSETSGSSPADGDPDWLKAVGKMLWAATNIGKDTETNLELLNAQRKACQAINGTPSDADREKAGSIYRKCKEVVTHEVEPEDALRILASYAKCSVEELVDGAAK
jgi:hypothetical protein